jgi:MtN3 and saliva related transmembrane protein
MNNLVSWLGGLAGLLTTIAFLPQVIETYQSKSAKGLSLSMLLIFCTGVILWLSYGILRNDIAIICTNVVTLALASLLLFFKIKYK